MKSSFLSFLVLVLFLISCTKNNDLSVTLNSKSSLSAKITDARGVGISNVKVKLLDYLYAPSSNNTSGPNDYLDVLTTDNTGNVNFGDLAAGTYTLTVDSIWVGGTKYRPYKIVQLIAASGKQITINAQDFTGTCNINFTKQVYSNDQYQYSGFNGLNVLLIPFEKFSDYDAIDALIAKADYSGQTNNNGDITFEIPSNRPYSLIVYTDDKKNVNNLTNYFNLDKGDNLKIKYTLTEALVRVNY